VVEPEELTSGRGVPPTVLREEEMWEHVTGPRPGFRLVLELRIKHARRNQDVLRWLNPGVTGYVGGLR